MFISLLYEGKWSQPKPKPIIMEELQLRLLAKKVNVTLPSTYIDLIYNRRSFIPENNKISIKQKHNIKEIKRQSPTVPIKDEYLYVKNFYNIYVKSSHSIIHGYGELPNKFKHEMLPFAFDSKGNQFCFFKITPTKQCITFIDHKSENYLVVADSYEEFMKILVK